MRCRSSETELYQTNKEILSGTDFLPPLLKYFMRLLFRSKIKQEVPKSVTPALLFGVSVEMGHIVGSKTLIIELAKLGFKSAMMKLNDSSNQLQFNPSQKTKKIFLHFFFHSVLEIIVTTTQIL